MIPKARTRVEWESRVIAAYHDDTCPHCGLIHPYKTVDDNGDVWQYCPYSEREYWVAHETPPKSFPAEVLADEDIPF